MKNFFNSNEQDRPKGDDERGAEVTEAKTLVNVDNLEFPNFFNLAKIPVLLSAPIVRFNVEAKIRLAEPAVEIKRIKKSIHVTQCELIPNTDQLFIGGYVRKNIEYATAQQTTSTAVSGDIRHTTVHVPFEFTTTIVFGFNFPRIGFRDEFEFVFNGQDGKQFSSDTFIAQAEKPFCEIEFAQIDEVDLFLDRKPLSPTMPREGVFQNLREKMSITLGISVLQNQLTFVDPPFVEEPPCNGNAHAKAAPARPLPAPPAPEPAPSVESVSEVSAPQHPLSKIHPALPHLPQQSKFRMHKRS